MDNTPIMDAINPCTGEVVVVENYEQALKELIEWQKHKKYIEIYEKTLKDAVVEYMSENNLKMVETDNYAIKLQQRQMETYNYHQVVEVFERFDLLDEILVPSTTKVKKYLKDYVRTGEIKQAECDLLNSTKQTKWTSQYLVFNEKKE